MQVLAVTCDNASNNAMMLKEMKKARVQFRGSEARIRCFGHVINLVVKVSDAALPCLEAYTHLTFHLLPPQAILLQFGQKVKSETIGKTDCDLTALDDPEDLDNEDEDETDKAREAADAADIDEEDEPCPELFVSDANIKLG